MTTLQQTSQEELRRLVEQIERLESDKADIARDISDKFKEAKSLGFDTKIMRQVIRMRKKSEAEREETESLLEIYMHALGMLADTPLGAAAIEREFQKRKTVKDVADKYISRDGARA